MAKTILELLEKIEAETPGADEVIDGDVLEEEEPFVEPQSAPPVSTRGIKPAPPSIGFGSNPFTRFLEVAFIRALPGWIWLAGAVLVVSVFLKAPKAISLVPGVQRPLVGMGIVGLGLMISVIIFFFQISRRKSSDDADAGKQKGRKRGVHIEVVFVMLGLVPIGVVIAMPEWSLVSTMAFNYLIWVTIWATWVLYGQKRDLTSDTYINHRRPYALVVGVLVTIGFGVVGNFIPSIPSIPWALLVFGLLLHIIPFVLPNPDENGPGRLQAFVEILLVTRAVMFVVVG